jgi:hypothetical protein
MSFTYVLYIQADNVACELNKDDFVVAGIDIRLLVILLPAKLFINYLI